MIEQDFHLKITVRAANPNEAHLRADRLSVALRNFVELTGTAAVEVHHYAASAGQPVPAREAA